ncbi:hypothetical protein LCGC14_2715750 [marine sediment metagenome]|uniref:Uncharacterized protein n=1 Tax=marine sediment metagenome TaxID=412755 RepID=A0A0F8ZZ96_9ZZZZ
MNKPKKKVERISYYYLPCDVCGKDVNVSKDREEPETCYDCQTEQAGKKAIDAGQFLIGAKIVELIPKYNGSYTNVDELSSLKVITSDNKVIEFTAGGWDERHIEWDEVELE